MEHKLNILLIEDNPADAGLICIYLKEAFSGKVSTTNVNRLSAGLEALDKSHFDIILLDLSLPDSSGLETFSSVFKKTSNTPVIVLTGLDDETVGMNAMKLGAQDFLIKGKIGSKSLSRSINYSIERNLLYKQVSEYSKKLEEQTEKLLSEKKKLSEAQKLAHLGSWEIEGSRITWSEEMSNILGLPVHNLDPTLAFFYGYIHPEDQDHVKIEVEEAAKKLKPFSLHYRIIRKDNKVRILHSKAEITKIKETGSICIVGTSQDVTERLQEEHIEKLVLAATQSFNSVIIRNRKGYIEWVNEGFTKLTGYVLDDVKGSFGEVLKKNNETDILLQKEYHNRVIRSKTPVTYESPNYTNKGNLFWTITTLTPVLDTKGKVERVLSIDSDISLRKQMEEELVLANKISEHSLMKGNKALLELQTAKKQLEESLKVKELFLANMSHEIRTPMNAIVGFTDLLMKAELSEDLRQYLNAIKTSGKNLLVIINDILDFSKIQNGKIPFEEIDLNVAQLVNSLFELLLPNATEKGIGLYKQIDKNIPTQLLGDPTRLTQILVNLIGNAIKFTEKGEVRISVDLLSLTATQAELKFSIRDTGIGISKNKLTTIFEGFTQAENNTTRKYGGTGLGLTIAKQLVEMQNGRIFVESQESMGSVFSFQLTFKLNQAEPHNLVKQTTSLTRSLTEHAGLHILLVEDNQLNQVLATKILTDWHWKVEVAENGLIALKKIKEQDFDLVLMDIQIPEIDGYETTRRIRHTLPAPKSKLPIIAMTAHALAGDADKCIKAGMNNYVSKPFNPEDLYTKIIREIQLAKKMTSEEKKTD